MPQPSDDQPTEDDDVKEEELYFQKKKKDAIRKELWSRYGIVSRQRSIGSKEVMDLEMY